uniref:Retrovirus-related Pol polyprotein from transposon TNT 1-94 n=1 Tax=Tanacetum cinerariifolium TaxID=118510 RepID=A0A699JUH3_TANCI|nr:retrovirus-related Pol polyprotein from transposon TNT 1-94 [Tanacetum cinerariifolium]
MFLEFNKTCEKRITPTAITDGERGFEQTKACYLQEVILFFKTIKDNFEGIQKALTKEVKEMKDVFEELEADVPNLKYQNLKDSIGNNPPTPDKDTPDFDSVFVIGKMQASIQGKDNVIRQLKKQLSQLQVTHSDTDRTLRVQTTDSQITNPYPNNRDAHLDYLRHLKESVETIRDIVEEAKVVRPLDRSIVSACRYTKHSQELLEYAIGTCPQGFQQRAKQLANTTLIRKKQVTIGQPSDRQDRNKQVHVVAVKP